MISPAKKFMKLLPKQSIHIKKNICMISHFYDIQTHSLIQHVSLVWTRGQSLERELFRKPAARLSGDPPTHVLGKLFHSFSQTLGWQSSHVIWTKTSRFACLTKMALSINSSFCYYKNTNLLINTADLLLRWASNRYPVWLGDWTSIPQPT